MTVFIVDTSAILSGKPLDFDGEIATTESVESEITKEGRDLRLFNFMKEKGLKIYRPKRRYIEEIKKIIAEKGEIVRLSSTDKDILALALEMKKNRHVCIVTDDYSIQNVASFLGVEYKGISQIGISKRFVWRYRCTGCKKIFKEYTPICPICGSPVIPFVHRRYSISNDR